jgi:hypothetical protein
MRIERQPFGSWARSARFQSRIFNEKIYFGGVRVRFHHARFRPKPRPVAGVFIATGGFEFDACHVG